MRLLFANDVFGDPGGVQSYLEAVAGGLARRGHQLAILHRDTIKPVSSGPFRELAQFSVATAGVEAALDSIGRWGPDVCFSHNMDVLDVDRELIARWPVVKFMHGYLGTCIGGQKRFGLPVAQPCDRRFSAACLALYGPRHCGKLSPGVFVRQYRWARDQHDLLDGYRAIVVASEHMRREFVRNGAQRSQVHVNPLFPTHSERSNVDTRRSTEATDWCVAFVGRMTDLKGGGLLVEAVAQASAELQTAIRLLLVGDGPRRAAWERRAVQLGVPCTAPGWLQGADKWRALREAALLAVPSTWPEPFGLVGLEAAALGIPAVAFDVGGIREWLRPGVNGQLVPADPPRSGAFADTLVRMLSDPDELTAMGCRAIRVASEMSLERHLDRLESILTEHGRPHADSGQICAP